MDFDRIFYVSFILRVMVVNVGHYNAKKSRLGTLKSFIVMLNPLAYVGMYGHHIRIGYRANKKTRNFLHIIEILLCIILWGP